MVDDARTPEQVAAAPHALARAMRAAARIQAAGAIVGTSGGAAAARTSVLETVATGSTAIGREQISVARYDDAGVIGLCRARGILTSRQCDAAEELARARALSLPSPWRLGGAGNGGHDDARDAAAAERYGDLLSAAPYACRAALAGIAMGEWPAAACREWPLPPATRCILREGLTAVADHLKISG